ncbi:MULTISPECIES: DUF7313 family protein [Salinibaculum]|uniref:DUF7313 family protein n=1 Tax=Salinibaculum TaxID=2732368 RepID=UPI0030CD2728
MPQVNIFGPIDAALGVELGIGDVLVVEALILGLILVNFITRRLAHGRHVSQSEESAEAVTRFLPHELLNIVLLLASFYYMTVDYHPGMVMSALVVGLVITDFFEFEARKAEARRGVPLDRPKGSLAASVLVLAYAGYQALFFLLAGPVSTVI